MQKKKKRKPLEHVDSRKSGKRTRRNIYLQSNNKIDCHKTFDVVKCNLSLYHK